MPRIKLHFRIARAAPLSFRKVASFLFSFLYKSNCVLHGRFSVKLCRSAWSSWRFPTIGAAWFVSALPATTRSISEVVYQGTRAQIWQISQVTGLKPSPRGSRREIRYSSITLHRLVTCILVSMARRKDSSSAASRLEVRSGRSSTSTVTAPRSNLSIRIASTSTTYVGAPSTATRTMRSIVGTRLWTTLVTPVEMSKGSSCHLCRTCRFIMNLTWSYPVSDFNPLASFSRLCLSTREYIERVKLSLAFYSC